MSIRDRLLNVTATVDENTAERLQTSPPDQHSVAVHPPANERLDATVDRFVTALLEYQTTWFGLKNTSPITAFEIRRAPTDTLTLQFTVPSNRLERKLRSQLPEAVPGVGFDDGNDGFPLTPGDTIGGGILTPSRPDFFPLATDFSTPPTNNLVGALHPHAMQNTRIVIQILFQPVAGQPLRRKLWHHRAAKSRTYLRTDKHKLTHTRAATPRERQKADAIEEKASTSRFHTAIRIVVIGAREYTPGRVTELAGPFNVYANPDTGQRLTAKPVRSLTENQILRFADLVADRRFGRGYSSFQTTVPELAGLVAIPDRPQRNIQTAPP